MPFRACYVFTSHSLATACYSGDSSALRAQVLSPQTPVQNYLTKSKSESALLYEWRFTANYIVMTSRALRLTTTEYFSIQPWRSRFLRNILSDERMGLPPINKLGLPSNVYIAYMLLKGLDCALCTNRLSVQALQSRSCLCYVSYATTAA
jgi:hypothetical protein